MCGCCTSSRSKLSSEVAENDKLVETIKLFMNALLLQFIEDINLSTALRLLIINRKFEAIHSKIYSIRNQSVQKYIDSNHQIIKKLVEKELQILNKIYNFIKKALSKRLEDSAITEYSMKAYVDAFNSHPRKAKLLNDVFSSYEKILRRTSNESKEISHFNRAKLLDQESIHFIDLYTKKVFNRIEKLCFYMKEASLVERFGNQDSDILYQFLR